MGKTIAITAKFTQEEADRIEAYAISMGTSKSAILHDLVISGLGNSTPDISSEAVVFRFTENYLYFWIGHEYPGFVRGNEAHIKFGGEWMIYKLSDIPAEVIRHDT